MAKVDYDQRMHAVYQRARGLPAASVDAWCDGFERHLPGTRPLTLVDVGSGTGRWTPVLAERFGGPVTGVEPSAKMRAVATTDSVHPGVTYVDGAAERLPLADASCDGALLFLVWHHVTDKHRAALELARVVRPGGTLLLRTEVAERLPRFWWHEAYPRAREVDLAMFEPESVTVAPFAAAGWRHTATDSVDYEIAPSKAAYLERLKLRGLSVFERLTEDETVAMFEALEAAVADDRDPGPVIETGTLLVFERAPIPTPGSG